MEIKAKVTVISVILGFLVQLVASVWFLSGMSSAFETHARMIESLQERYTQIAPVTYDVVILKEKAGAIERSLSEIKENLRTLVKR